tara:strand:+ start:141 stop:821 length:681 start_codon:yes stop_codon:yes gene_type:complete
MKNITAVIPVRKGSERVKNKNIKPFADTTLLENKILQLKKVKNISKIVVSTDCDKCLQVAKKLEVDTHIRDDYYASSAATNSEFFKNLAESIEADYIMYSPVTSPLISLNTYHECIYKFNQSNDIKNLVTVSNVKHHLWKDGQPLNYDIRESPNSQDLPDIYSINYAVCLISRQDMITYRNVVTESPVFYVTDEIESIDIDTEFDFMIAEMVYKELKKSGKKIEKK